MANPRAKQSKPKTSKGPSTRVGAGGEVHQISDDVVLTTNQGIPISDDQSSLKAGRRGPTLLEDFVLREKITHFDHERIPERVVHARGYGAHGYFELEHSLSRYTRADLFQKPGQRTPVFVRFSTVAGGAGSVDLPRDVRGFAIKFYTQEGNFDIVGNDIPVFFIQDAMKFPDLVHSVKMEPDRGFPQAASAHDTFWDFASLTPEATHMLMWVMSDRGIPRSVRMIEGFGVHTFRLVDAAGRSTFVKWHLRPVLGLQSVLWDEAVKICGADPDYHRRDLWEAIDAGKFPAWDFYVQLFTEDEANGLPFDVLDPTKLIPEERVPLKKIGRLVLDRNPDNFFAETEQVAFCPANVVPGIDFTDDPLLQGRLFSYLDTQITRLGGPNHHQIPINAPKCPMHNFQRDGHMQMAVPKGEVAYEPGSLDDGTPRESVKYGFTTFPRLTSGEALRARPESFADHYTQARIFWKSQTDVERSHLVSAIVFELGKVTKPAIRERAISRFANVDASLAARIAKGLGMKDVPAPAPTAVPAVDMPPSPGVALAAKARRTIEGRKIACLVTDGADGATVAALRTAIEGAGATFVLVAPKISGVTLAKGKAMAVDAALRASPSVLFDAVVLAVSTEGAAALASDASAVDFVRDAFGHLKIIGHTEDATALLDAAGVRADEGIVRVDRAGGPAALVAAASKHRVWAREASIHEMP